MLLDPWPYDSRFAKQNSGNHYLTVMQKTQGEMLVGQCWLFDVRWFMFVGQCWLFAAGWFLPLVGYCVWATVS